jgi:transcriptional regulator ATRX
LQPPQQVILLEIIAAAWSRGEKTVIFSQYTQVLDIIERTLAIPGWGRCDVKQLPPQPLQEWGPWMLNEDMLRIDGKVQARRRQELVRAFNKRGHPSKVFLLSTKAGNMGINLVAANRVVLMDTSWNPSNDLQAMFRCYRYGQQKPVTVYRLVAAPSLEEKILSRQVRD